MYFTQTDDHRQSRILCPAKIDPSQEGRINGKLKFYARILKFVAASGIFDF